MSQYSEDARGSTDTSRLLVLWLHWVVGSTLAAAVGWFLAVFGILFTFGFSAILAGPIVGTLVGWIQERVLRSHLPVVNWSRWTLRSAISMSVAWYVLLMLFIVIDAARAGVSGDASSLGFRLAELGVLVFAGSILGMIQSGGLKGLGGKRRWVICNAVGWVVAGLVAPVLASPLDGYPDVFMFVIPGAFYYFALGTFSVLLASLVSATTLVLLVRGQDTDVVALR